MKVSVIVAAYNAEKYVTETMESLANQSIDDYEIIVVNDGSKDHTIDILRDYESRYDNITVVDKENTWHGKVINRQRCRNRWHGDKTYSGKDCHIFRCRYDYRKRRDRKSVV